MSQLSNTDVIHSLHTAMRRMADAARENDWSKVDTLDHERRRLTSSLQRGQSVGASERQQIEEILSLNREVLALCEQARDEAGEQLRSLNSGKIGCAAYQANTR